MAFNPEGKNLAEIYPALTEVQSWLSMMACLDPISDSTLITKVQSEKVQPHLDTLYDWFMGPKPVVEPFDAKLTDITKIGEIEFLDSDGTYTTYYLVEHKEREPLDIEGLKAHAQLCYEYHGLAGDYFCSRINVWPHPFMKHEAIIETKHQKDI